MARVTITPTPKRGAETVVTNLKLETVASETLAVVAINETRRRQSEGLTPNGISRAAVVKAMLKHLYPKEYAEVKARLARDKRYMDIKGK